MHQKKLIPECAALPLLHIHPQPFQKKDAFPWKGKVSGTWSIALRSSPKKDENNPHENTLADLKKGSEVTVLEKSGIWYKVKGKNSKGEEVEGFASSHYIIPSTVFDLNQTVGAVGKDMDELYEKSFNEDKTAVEEWGASVVESEGKISATNKKTDHKGGSMTINHTTEDGETLIGDVHTHPYSKAEGSHEGIAFSSADISNLRNHLTKGFQRFV